ncbi:MAG: hypothetical protein H7X99_05335 [Saprospiraceae bacterium]|nr:hypothetical protein [Saprospiraceae bacterium]
MRSSLLFILVMAIATCKSTGQSSALKPIYSWVSEEPAVSSLDEAKLFNFHSYDTYDPDQIFIHEIGGKRDDVSMFCVFRNVNGNKMGELKRGASCMEILDTAVVFHNWFTYHEQKILPRFVSIISMMNGPKFDNFGTNMYIGGDTKFKYGFQGEVAEILYFDQILENKNQQIVESKLAMKYGIDLREYDDYLNGNGHPIWTFSQNGRYTHNITFIGKDRLTDLDQRQSNNVNNEISLILSLNDLQISNADNHSDILDGDYIFWSDDNENFGFKEDIASQVSMMPRKWKMNLNWNTAKDELLKFSVAIQDIPNYDLKKHTYVLVSSSESGLKNMVGEFVKMDWDTKFGLYTAALPLRPYKGNYYFSFIQSENDKHLKNVVSRTTQNSISLQPNPVNTGQNITIRLGCEDCGTHKIQIMTKTGMVIKDILVSEFEVGNAIHHEFGMPGVYIIHIANDRDQQNYKVIVI